MQEQDNLYGALWNNDDLDSCNYMMKDTDNSIDRLCIEELKLALNSEKKNRKAAVTDGINMELVNFSSSKVKQRIKQSNSGEDNPQSKFLVLQVGSYVRGW